MGNLEIDTKALKNSVIPPTSSAITFLGDAKTTLSGIDIPSDFSGGGVIKTACNSISNIIGDLNKVTSGVNAIVSAFDSKSALNEALVDELLGKILKHNQRTAANLREKIRMQEIMNKLHPGGGRGQVNSNGESLFQGNTFLETVMNCWQFLYNNRYNIYYSPGGNQIPFEWSAENFDINNGYIDCSSFVSWVLYEYGYNSFAGEQHYTWNYWYEPVSEEDDSPAYWQSKYHWKIEPANGPEEAATIVEPGSIVVIREPGKAQTNNMSICL